MWILDAESDFLEGKRVWLRPGKKYLFGRIRQDGVRHAIQHTSISRKHMIIEVSAVKPGDGCHIHTKSEITVTDLGSKCGTIVDGEQIRGDSRTLSGEEHTLMLGRYAQALRIKWQPVVLSFSFSTKDLRTGDPLARVCSRLEDLDIKTVIPYIVDKTTHVVQKKRNTAKGLQALINGKYIVQDSYLDALVYAATPSDLENLESLSPLETDFDSAWPEPMEHLPPPGKEPVPRPAAAFAPNPDRINVFEGYTFVFGDSSQFDTLCGPINNGHGKALLYKIESEVTTAEDIVQFMANAAGQKGLGGEREEPGGVVLVRPLAKGPWEISLYDEVAQITDQRIIEQSEFLDAILQNDASSLCRPLPRELAPSQDSDAAAVSEAAMLVSGETAQRLRTSPSAGGPSQRDPTTSQPESSLPTNTRIKRPKARTFVSKVKMFDDGFDMEAIPPHPTEKDNNSQKLPAPMDAEPLPEQQTQQTQHDTHLQEEEDMVSSLLPGANAMKRRRAEMDQHQRDVDPVARPKEEAPPKPKRQKLDVIEEARKHRDEEEDAQRQRRQEDEAQLQASLKDMDVEQMKNLAIVEEMEMPTREPRSRKAEDADNNRWDERWNGRKNFKKFRRKGESNLPRRRVQAVIVPLEEVKRKDFGIGDQYWASSGKATENNSQRESQWEREPLVSQETTGGTGTATATATATATGTGAASVSQRLARMESGSTSEAPRATPTSRSQKRAREVRDSDSDDELRFRFRRKR